jgi:hypothetical protein
MDFGKLFSRAWDILWKNLFLILLAVLAVLGGAGSGGSSQSRYVFQGSDFQWQDLPHFDFGRNFGNWGIPAAAVGGIVLLALVAVLIGLVFWALGAIARGGLISGVNDLEENQPTDFMAAFQAGWDKGWKLLGIALIPAIPGLVLLALLLGSLVLAGGWDFMGRFDPIRDGWSALSPLLVLSCLLIPAALALSLLRTFANRACMLENTGVLASYQRGIEVLGDNLGSAVILFLLQIAISIGVGLAMIVPGILSALCCLLWPLLILFQAGFVAFYSILWTLAWREWVGAEVVEA